jgi:hypothetical protein
MNDAGTQRRGGTIPRSEGTIRGDEQLEQILDHVA